MRPVKMQRTHQVYIVGTEFRVFQKWRESSLDKFDTLFRRVDLRWLSCIERDKAVRILPSFSLSRFFISSTCSLGIIPLSLNTPVFFCRYSSAVRLPVRLPSVVMYLNMFLPPVISKNARSSACRSNSSSVAFFQVCTAYTEYWKWSVGCWFFTSLISWFPPLHSFRGIRACPREVLY